MVDGVRSDIKKYAPRWRLNSSLIWLIVYNTQMNNLRKYIDIGEEIMWQIGLPYAIHVRVVYKVVSSLAVGMQMIPFPN